MHKNYVIGGHSFLTKKITKAISKCWTSIGGSVLNIREDQDRFTIMIYPATWELYGGKDDGQKGFPGFHLNIARFCRLFDRPGPIIALDCIDKNITDHLVFNGEIDGIKVTLAVLVAPPEGAPSMEKVYTVGPKIGEVESID